MQFKLRGRRIQVLAYRGRCPTRGRSVVRMIGSINAETLEPIGRIMTDATNEERLEIQEFIVKTKLDRENDLLRKSILDLPKTLRTAAMMIKDQINPSEPSGFDPTWARDVRFSFAQLDAEIGGFLTKNPECILSNQGFAQKD